ncbi:MAG: thymidylate synthase [Candidatus Nezhaarchaeales archaeon]
MKHVKITAFNCPDAWFQVLKRIWEEGEVYYVEYGSEVGETKKLDVTIEILHPEVRPLLDERAPFTLSYLNFYFLQYMWLGVKEAEETYTYSYRLRKARSCEQGEAIEVDQVEEALKRLSENLFDRQVTLVVERPEDILKEFCGRRHEPPCLRLIDVEVCRDVDGRLALNLTCYFRSWDAYGGLPANIAAIQLWNETFVGELNERLRLKGFKEEVHTGKLIFHSKNCHIYKRNYEFVKELLTPQKVGSRFERGFKLKGS